MIPKKVAQTYTDQLVPEKLFRYCKKKEMVKYRSLTHIVFKIFGTFSVGVAQ